LFAGRCGRTKRRRAHDRAPPCPSLCGRLVRSRSSLQDTTSIRKVPWLFVGVNACATHTTCELLAFEKPGRSQLDKRESVSSWEVKRRSACRDRQCWKRCLYYCARLHFMRDFETRPGPEAHPFLDFDGRIAPFLHDTSSVDYLHNCQKFRYLLVADRVSFPSWSQPSHNQRKAWLRASRKKVKSAKSVSM
jgi:hypothetical protein